MLPTVMTILAFSETTRRKVELEALILETSDLSGHSVEGPSPCRSSPTLPNEISRELLLQCGTYIVHGPRLSVIMNPMDQRTCLTTDDLESRAPSLKVDCDNPVKYSRGNLSGHPFQNGWSE